MTKLSEQDLQNVSGGVTRMTQNSSNNSGGPGPFKPEEEDQDSGAK